MPCAVLVLNFLLSLNISQSKSSDHLHRGSEIPLTAPLLPADQMPYPAATALLLQGLCELWASSRSQHLQFSTVWAMRTERRLVKKILEEGLPAELTCKGKDLRSQEQDHDSQTNWIPRVSWISSVSRACYVIVTSLSCKFGESFVTTSLVSEIIIISDSIIF